MSQYGIVQGQKGYLEPLYHWLSTDLDSIESAPFHGHQYKGLGGPFRYMFEC